MFTWLSSEEPTILRVRASSVHLFTSPRSAMRRRQSLSRCGGNSSFAQPPWKTLLVGGVYGRFSQMSSAMCGKIGAII